MAVECVKCGQCCRQINLRTQLDEVMAEFWSAHYGQTVTEAEFHVDHNCIHLTKDNRCDIYETRPQYCRNFYCQQPGLLVVQTKAKE